MSGTTKFESGWAIVELMGHARFAGFCSEESMFGGAMLRIDVPETDDQAAFTKYYGGGAIYAFTPCTEETARRAARSFAARPPHFYDAPLPRIAAAHAASDGPGDDDDDDLNEPYYAEDDR